MPICDRDRRIVGYELSFRDTPAAQVATGRGDEVTATVLVNTFTEFGLPVLVGEKTAFVNVTASFLDGRRSVPFPPDNAVLEILTAVPVTPGVVSGVRSLREQGYVFAVDDHGFTPGRADLLPHVSYAKIDLQANNADVVRALTARCRDRELTLVAERVETADHLAVATELGFELVQGWYFARPELISGATIGPGQVATMQVLGLLARPECDVDDIEALVRMDVGLTYRVLRAVNSAASGLHRTVSSVRDALVMLGFSTLRRWLILMVLADSCVGDPELVSNACARGRTCELLAGQWSGVTPEAAFTVGMLSELDALLGMPLPEALGALPLDDGLRAALVDGSGPLGALLGTVLAYEAGDVDAAASTSQVVGVGIQDVARAYLSGFGWALQTVESVVAA
ncbi:MAG: EAL and HDOD domain-containing protein [Actinomycetes bacterium]